MTNCKIILGYGYSTILFLKILVLVIFFPVKIYHSSSMRLGTIIVTVVVFKPFTDFRLNESLAMNFLMDYSLIKPAN